MAGGDDHPHSGRAHDRPADQNVSYTLTLANTSQVETKFVTVRYPVPENLTVVRTTPLATVSGTDLYWTLGEFAAGQSRQFQIDFHTVRNGVATHQVTAITDENRQTEQKLTLQIATPQLEVTKLIGPETGAVNVPIRYEITVTNTGTAPATNLLLQGNFDEGLSHASGAKSLELHTSASLAPGQSHTEVLTLTPSRAGRLSSRITASADGVKAVVKEHAAAVQDARLEVKVAGPAWRYANHAAEWTVDVTNVSEMAQQQVELRATLPLESGFKEAGEEGQWNSNGVVLWKLGNLEAHGHRTVHLKTTCGPVTSRTVQTFVATAASGLVGKAEAALEIRGLPALRLDVQDQVDPVAVGGMTGYRIDVENVGSLEASGVQIVATVPPELRVLTVGPTPWRLEEDRLIFFPLDRLQPKQKMSYYVQVQALKAAAVRFHVELSSSTLTKKVIAEEATHIFEPLGEAGRLGSRLAAIGAGSGAVEVW